METKAIYGADTLPSPGLPLGEQFGSLAAGIFHLEVIKTQWKVISVVRTFITSCKPESKVRAVWELMNGIHAFPPSSLPGSGFDISAQASLMVPIWFQRLQLIASLAVMIGTFTGVHGDLSCPLGIRPTPGPVTGMGRWGFHSSLRSILGLDKGPAFPEAHGYWEEETILELCWLEKGAVAVGSHWCVSVAALSFKIKNVHNSALP